MSRWIRAGCRASGLPRGSRAGGARRTASDVRWLVVRLDTIRGGVLTIAAAKLWFRTHASITAVASTQRPGLVFSVPGPPAGATAGSGGRGYTGDGDFPVLVAASLRLRGALAAFWASAFLNPRDTIDALPCACAGFTARRRPAWHPSRGRTYSIGAVCASQGVVHWFSSRVLCRNYQPGSS